MVVGVAGRPLGGRLEGLDGLVPLALLLDRPCPGCSGRSRRWDRSGSPASGRARPCRRGRSLKASTPLLACSMALMRCWLQTNESQADMATAIASRILRPRRHVVSSRRVLRRTALTRRAAAGGREAERIGDDDDTAAEGLGELPATHRLDHAVLDAGVAHGRVLEHRGHHLAGRGDGELHRDAAAELRLAGQLLLVAVLHLVDVAPDDAADDLLVQRPAHVGLAGDDVRAPWPGDRPDRRRRGRSPSPSRRRRPCRWCRGCRGRWCPRRCRRRPRRCRPDPDRRRRRPRRSGCRSGRRARSRRRCPSAVSRPKIEAMCEPSAIFSTPRMPAFLTSSSASFLARWGSMLSLGPLRPYRPSLFLEVFFPILPSSPLWRLPLPPCSSGPFFLSHSGISSSFSSGRLDQEVHEAVVGVEQIERQRLGVGRDREDHQQEQQQGDGRADRVDLLAPLPGEEGHLERARLRACELTRKVVSPQSMRARPRSGSEKLAPRCWTNCCSGMVWPSTYDLAGHLRGDVDHEVAARRWTTRACDAAAGELAGHRRVGAWDRRR